MDDPAILSLIAKMTLDEKIGQMSQVNTFYGPMPEEFAQAIRDGKIGSILNQAEVEVVNELQRIAVEESRLGIPILFGRDVIHGFKTIFPIPLGQAASWNPALAEKGTRISAMEAWSSGINWTFAPMLDISRDPRWGRIAESLGEDPFLASQFAEAMVKGFQGEDLKNEGTILACAKHFAGYGAAEGGRDYNTTMIPEGELRNVYLKPFLAARQAGVGSFMSGFNELNGVPATGNQFLLRDVLKGEWQYDGFVVSDWASITEMLNHGFVADTMEAANKAVHAGVDMEMATTSYFEHLADLVSQGLVKEALLDEAVYRILKAKFDLGLFDDPYVEKEKQNQFAKKEYLDAAYHSSLQSMVLLKNDNEILPVDTLDAPRIAVIGPMAQQKYEQLGTWVFDADTNLSITPLEALQESFGRDRMLFTPGLVYSRDKRKNGFAEAIQTAKKADIVLMCMGEEAIITGEAHCRADIGLPGAQDELIRAVAETGKPIVMFIMAGRPLTIGAISEYVDAIVYAFHPGTMGGKALAHLLSGRENFSGKLPVTFPRSVGQIPFYYNHKNTGRPSNENEWTPIDEIPIRTPQTSLGNSSHYLDIGYEPLYPFGFGMSYTDFEYGQLMIDTPEIGLDDTLVVSVSITNTGAMRGEEIAQLYVRDLVADVTRPVRELKGFKRVSLNPGESKQIHFQLPVSDLSFYNQRMEKVVEPGDFDIWIGGSSTTGEKGSFRVNN